MSSPGRTFRVFISSTFSDLEAERNALQERVFPRLRDLCLARGARFQAIDLRWGVSDEAAGDYQTMRICLDEIERCQQTTPRPNFIILLGDRYGWRPLPAQIPAAEFDNILLCLPADAEGMRRRALLRACYRLDENAVEPIVCLQPDKRGCDCAALYPILEEATAAQPPELRPKYLCSATDQEIWCGALGVSEEARASVFCFIRSIEPLESTEGDDLYVDRLEGRVDADAQARLRELKGRLKRALPKQNFRDYRALRKDAGITTDHLLGPLTEDLHRDGRPNLCQDVYDALATVIQEEIGRDQEADPLETELASHAAFAQQLAAPQFFAGRAEILAQLAGCVSQRRRNR
jgi:NACHT domain- and WD repeat-containing protein